MSCLARPNRYKAVLSKGDRGHYGGAGQDVVTLFQDRWGTSFAHHWNDELLRQEMDVLESSRSWRTVQGFREEKIPIYIELRSMSGNTFHEFLGKLSDNEFCLSIADVANRLSPDSSMLLPEHLVLVCGGGSYLAAPPSYHEMYLVGFRNVIPLLTITRKGRVSKLELDVVESGVCLQEAFVPIGTFREN